MIGAFFDRYILVALRSGWEQYAKELVTFRGFFPVQAAMDAGEVERWFNLFQETPPTFMHAREEITGVGMPLVTVRLTRDEETESFIGDAALHLDKCIDEYVITTLGTQEVEVDIYTSQDDTTRALYAIVKGILMLMHLPLIKVGFDAIKFEKGGDLEDAEQLVAEGAGIFVRRQIWLADYTAQVRQPKPDFSGSFPPTWYLHTDNLKTSANPIKPNQMAPVDPSNPAPPSRVLDEDGSEGGVSPYQVRNDS